ncbi:hypothetical protein MPL1032_180171 [Mesorhizobium plurifarium]|uniref:Uncharacterized protein n=1 Tax=Mesorhizobium plurifarium TaxID=69974 RepID=A0A0K2VUI7_MESPL|nr:hypothetical protein MPL1032_180171 [Mesorhizobium plurifarium]
MSNFSLRFFQLKHLTESGFSGIEPQWKTAVRAWRVPTLIFESELPTPCVHAFQPTICLSKLREAPPIARPAPGLQVARRLPRANMSCLASVTIREFTPNEDLVAGATDRRSRPIGADRPSATEGLGTDGQYVRAGNDAACLGVAN